MDKYTITYKQAKDLGFKRTEMHCSVFFDRNGFEDFVMELEIGSFAFDWDNITHEIRLMRIVGNGRIAGTLKIVSQDQFIDMLTLFGVDPSGLNT